MIRTGYSFRTAVGKLENVMSRLIECKYPAAIICDRASAFAWVRWSKLSKENKLKPVYGVELAVERDGRLPKKRPIVDYWKFIAKDNLSELNALITLATSQFYHEPLLTYKQAQENNLFKIVGYRSDLSKIKPANDLFVGLSPSISSGYYSEAKKKGFRFVKCSDNKYPRKENQALYETICGRNASLQTYDQYIQTENEWLNSIAHLKADTKSADSNFRYILKNSTAELKIGSLIHPKHTLDLRELCERGAVKLGINLKDKTYKSRLDRELKLIKEKKFEDYFYIISDLCKWARGSMVVGPARGSSCGSLVCYLLGITTVDPLPYGLIFERFIDINRNDLPDIDIDFPDEKREQVFTYLRTKYGNKHLAKLGTVSLYKIASVLNEAGASLKIPKKACDDVIESALKRSSGDARALESVRETFETMAAGKELLKHYPEIMIAEEMEGHPRHHGQHASAAILTKDPIEQCVPIDKRTEATHCDKKDAEILNLLKIDILGLTQLSIFEEIFRLLKIKDTEYLTKIPLDDKKAFQLLNQGRFSGIFQFNGMALQSLTREFKVQVLNDIVAITALARPGPMTSGGAHSWVQRRAGKQEVEYPHKMFEPYLKDTLGIVLYQEQVMEIGRNVGDLSWDDVTALRKAMSKSLGKEYFDQWGNKWKKGAIAKGGDPAQMEKIWDQLCSYGSWSFNKSHAIAYGLVSYYCCWFKAHHPLEFAAASLSYEPDAGMQIKLLREFTHEGYKYIPIDAKISSNKWIIKDRKLVGPITNVKGVGPKTTQKILDAREKGEELSPAMKKKLQTSKVSTLWPIRDSFDRAIPNPVKAGIVTPRTLLEDFQEKKNGDEVVVFCVLSKINPRDQNEAVHVAKRGGKIMKGSLTVSLNLQLTDDTGTVFGKIDRFKFPKIGKPVVEAGKVGKLLYVVKGKVKIWGTFHTIAIDQIKLVGFMS